MQLTGHLTGLDRRIRIFGDDARHMTHIGGSLLNVRGLGLGAVRQGMAVFNELSAHMTQDGSGAAHIRHQFGQAREQGLKLLSDLGQFVRSVDFDICCQIPLRGFVQHESQGFQAAQGGDVEGQHQVGQQGHEQQTDPQSAQGPPAERGHSLREQRWHKHQDHDAHGQGEHQTQADKLVAHANMLQHAHAWLEEGGCRAVSIHYVQQRLIRQPDR